MLRIEIVEPRGELSRKHGAIFPSKLNGAFLLTSRSKRTSVLYYVVLTVRFRGSAATEDADTIPRTGSSHP